MSFEEQFDRSVRQKIQDVEFPFDEANWAKAASLLDTEKALTKVGNTTKWVVISIATITFLSFGAYIAYQYNQFLKQTSKTSQSNNSIATEFKLNEQPIDKAIASNAETLTVQRFETDYTSNQSNRTHSKSNPSINEERKLANLKSTPHTQVNSIAIVGTSQESVGNTYHVTNQPNQNQIQETIQNNSNVTSNTTNASTHNSFTEAGFTTQQTNLDLNQALATNNEQNNLGDNKNATPTQSNYFAPPALDEIDTSLLSGNSNERVQIATIPVGSISIEQEATIKQTPFSILPRYEEDYYKKGVKYKTHFLNVEAGANYWLGWNTQNHKDATGLNWYLGANYAYYLTKRVALGIGAQTYNISHVNQPFYSTQKTEYGFGSVKTTSIVTTNKLNYFAVPLKVYYRINRFNQIAIGLNAAYVYRTTNSVQSSTTSESSPVVVTNHNLYDGVQSLNYNLLLSYRVKAYNRWWLSLEGSYGLSDVFNGNLNTNTFERPIGLRVGLQYSVFDK